MVDNQTLLRYDDFISRIDIKNEYDEISDENFGWNIILLTGYIENGCHEISILGQSEQRIIELEEKINICINE